MPPAKRSSKHAKKGKLKEKPLLESSSPTASLTKILLGFLSFFVAVYAILLASKQRIKSQAQQKQQLQHEKLQAESRDKWPRADPGLAFLLGQACRTAYCHDALQVVNRSFRATRTIEAGEVLFDIPRHLQIWDLDALRDPFVREHLFKANHKLSGNNLNNEAYLAAYLALQLNKAKQDHSDVDPAQLAYLDILPDLKDLNYHPILMDVRELKALLGESHAHATVHAYKNMIISEYDAFCNVSPDFQERVSRVDYFVARINVLTRSLPVGPPPSNEVVPGSFLSGSLKDSDLLRDELHAYKEILGIDFEKQGCTAMIPLADLFNHHPLNNVEYNFLQRETSTKGSFIVRAEHRNIELGFEPMASYGIMTDSQLYSRYGFVNGDGSGITEVSLAVHHAMLKHNISSIYDYMPSTGMTPKFREFQERVVAKYISYDDGYLDCIPGPSTHPEEADLKRLKWEHLLKIANDIDKWIMLMPARNPFSYPNTNTESLITDKPPQFIRSFIHDTVDLEKFFETCRLMELVGGDFDGRAAEILRDNLKNDSFAVGPGNDSLEFRAHMCLGRWMGTALLTLEELGSLAETFEKIQELNQNEFGSRKWTATHVRFAEMQSHQAIANVVYSRMKSIWTDQQENPDPNYFMRENQCPEEYSKYLWENAGQGYDDVSASRGEGSQRVMYG